MNDVARVVVGLKRFAHSEGLDIPSYQSDGAAGLDLMAAIAAGESFVIAPGKRALVETGIAIELPIGFEAQVRPRSGLALRSGITILNSPGTIDADYRGEIKVILINLGEKPVTIERGARIAQLVVAPVSRIEFAEADLLAETARGSGGFGSTGPR